MGSVTCISWKSDLIVRGDSEGNINVYNVKTRECKNSNTGRGCVRKIRFSPGKYNLKMLVSRQTHPSLTRQKSNVGFRCSTLTGCRSGTRGSWS